MKTSLSPISGQEYQIPKDLNDRAAIDCFRDKHRDNKIIVVQGLGFVGSVMSLVVANALHAEYAVIGVDVPSSSSYWKIASINEGIFPVVSSDQKIATYFSNTQKKANLYATYDEYAYSIADVVIVDINLDVSKVHTADKALLDYSVDLTDFKQGISSIAKNCKEDVLILVESTVPPGMCDKMITPILNEVFDQRGLDRNYRLGHSYERVMPGPNYVDSIQNFYRVYSGIDEKSADAVEEFLMTVISVENFPLTRLTNTTATEMAKVLENSYRAMNIGFIQEWTEFAENAGVNLFEVIDAIKMRPTHANLMKPGIGVGGYCLTKDPLLASWSAQEVFSSRALAQSERAVDINDSMPLHTFSVAESLFPNGLSNCEILLLGVSYLSDVADTRFTPVELLYDKLLTAGGQITLHDPHVKYWEEKKLPVETSLKKIASQEFQLIIICTGHRIYSGSVLMDLLDVSNAAIIDSIGILDGESIHRMKRNKIVRIIGRGDV